MFYRIKNDKIYDYADYEYEAECLYTNLCTMKEFVDNREKYIIEDGVLVIVPDWEDVLAQKRKNQFEKDFFETTLGWIRRKVTMKDGSVKDFLADILLSIKAGLELGNDVKLITYKQPDFRFEITKEYLESLQEIKFATLNFVQECLFQTVQDFGLEEGGNNGF